MLRSAWQIQHPSSAGNGVALFATIELPAEDFIGKKAISRRDYIRLGFNSTARDLVYFRNANAALWGLIPPRPGR